MPNHPNRGWRKRWAVDLDAKTATHETGFKVKFRKDPRGWIGDAIAGVDQVHPMDHARLMEQATESFQRAFAADAAAWTPEQYQTNLKRVEELMRSRKGSAHGRELDALVDAIGIYERKHFPMSIRTSRTTPETKK